MIQDLQFIVLSYLRFEEVVPILGYQSETLHKFVRVHEPEIPFIDALKNNDFETLKYMYTFKDFIWMIRDAIEFGHLRIVKHCIQAIKTYCGIDLSIYLDLAVKCQWVKIITYFLEIDVHPTEITKKIIFKSKNFEIYKIYYLRFGYDTLVEQILPKSKKLRKFIRKQK